MFFMDNYCISKACNRDNNSTNKGQNKKKWLWEKVKSKNNNQKGKNIKQYRNTFQYHSLPLVDSYFLFKYFILIFVITQYLSPTPVNTIKNIYLSMFFILSLSKVTR